MTPRCPLCGGVVVGSHFHGIDPEQRCDACDTLADLRGAAVCACSLAALRRALAEQAAGEAERVREAVEAERHTIVACLRERRDATDAALVAGMNVAINMVNDRARATSPAPESSTPRCYCGREATLLSTHGDPRCDRCAACDRTPATALRTTSPAPVADPQGPGDTVADGWRERLAHAAAYCAHPWPVVRRDDLRAALRELTPAAHPAGRAATDAAKAARARGEDVYADGEGRCEPAPASPPAERCDSCFDDGCGPSCPCACHVAAVTAVPADSGHGDVKYPGDGVPWRATTRKDGGS